jgi:hypothetical protein
VRVRTSAACEWNANASVGWISIESGRTGTGNGEVRYSVSRNTSTAERTGSVKVAGQTLTVTQRGESPKPEKVDVEGAVGGLSGSCPSLSMRVGGNAVVTDGSTKFKGGSCGDIRNGVNVSVKGTRVGEGPIQADDVRAGGR